MVDAGPEDPKSSVGKSVSPLHEFVVSLTSLSANVNFATRDVQTALIRDLFENNLPGRVLKQWDTNYGHSTLLDLTRMRLQSLLYIATRPRSVVFVLPAEYKRWALCQIFIF